jgi:negative regulator of PHO system
MHIRWYFYIKLEMINGKPLFTGVSESDQLKKIFKIRGTPNEKTYPEIKTLPDWNVKKYNDFTKF